MILHLRDFPYIFILFASSVIFTCSVGAAEPFEAFLTKYCVDCHGPDKEKGDLRIDKLSREFNTGIDSHHWGEVIEQINAGDMPPKKKKQPKKEEIAEFVLALDSRLKAGKAARMASRPAVAHYRLSRKEYENTVYDLLGVRYDPTKPGELNEDTLWHGYERIGSELSLSPSHINRYYQAADIVLDRALKASNVEARKARKSAIDLGYRGKNHEEALKRFGVKNPLRYLLFPGTVKTAFSSSWLGKTGPEHSGLYKVRIKASGLRPEGSQPVHLSIGKKTSESTVDGLIEFDITAPEDKPEIYEFEVFLEMPAHLQFCVVATKEVDRRSGGAFRGALGNTYLFTHTSETGLLNPNAPQVFDDKGNGIFSTVLLDYIEWEGPIVTNEEKSLRSGLMPPNDAKTEVVEDYLKRFAERAWRRQVKKEELAQYINAYKSEREAGEKTADAYRVALQGVLTSRHFIYLVEGDPEVRNHLTDYELASRLSYFLWSSMPDDNLLSKANQSKLNGEGLKKEVDRMISDSRINRLIDDFTRQWLQLHKVGMFPPNKSIYKNYDAWLETSMKYEPVEFFREMFKKNMPIDNFIESDWTIVNARLSGFYGLPETQGTGYHRAALKPEDNRGGLLTMGAVLGLTSDGTRHRPVHRGVWLSEAIFNKTPPPPPANVDPIEPTPPKGKKQTIREKLEHHAKDPNCASCHAKIDPLGFAWDNYDAIGQWRTHEKNPGGVGKDPEVNSTGTMTDGRAFKDPRQFKQLVLEDKEKFLKAFVEHISTYALRRVLTWDDKDGIQEIVDEAQKNQYGLKYIVRAVALSKLIQKR
ncbi:MAG: DUF1592 domain-containing protein [Lentisphaeraceae bacterium]|nr:DUF1592 domain-containing protein [Lentisphaeraceae bacterium]